MLPFWLGRPRSELHAQKNEGTGLCLPTYVGCKGRVGKYSVPQYYSARRSGSAPGNFGILPHQPSSAQPGFRLLLRLPMLPPPRRLPLLQLPPLQQQPVLYVYLCAYMYLFPERGER
jgi:hypothetical protein